MFFYWTKLISGKQTKLCSITYRLMFHLFSTQNANFQWLTYVKGIFDECGFTYIWNSQNFINDRWIKENNNQCLWDQFQWNWNDDLQTCSKAINYRIAKILLDLKIILTCNLCNSDIGDEFHYILRCSFLKMKEKLILRKMCTEGPTFYALKKLCHPKINRIV